MNRLTSVLERSHGTRTWRAWRRYGAVRGNVLAGGVAYFAFFSLFPVLALGFTVFGLVVDGQAELRLKVADVVNGTFGATVIGARPGEGVWSMDQLVQSNVLTMAGFGGAVVLLFVGLGWIGALRAGVSAVFGPHDRPHPVVAKLSDVGVLIVFGLSVLASLVGGLVVSTATGVVLDWLGLTRSRAADVLVSVLSALVLLAIDTLLFLLLLRALSGASPALDDVFTGALAGGVGIGLLKLGGGFLLHLLSSNNWFAAAASIIVGLLIWMNLAARFILLAAAWAATTAADRGHLDVLPPVATSVPIAVTGASSAAGSGSALMPTYSPRAADRTTLVAGAVLGATAAVGVRALAHAGRLVRYGPSRNG